MFRVSLKFACLITFAYNVFTSTPCKRESSISSIPEEYKIGDSSIDRCLAIVSGIDKTVDSDKLPNLEELAEMNNSLPSEASESTTELNSLEPIEEYQDYKFSTVNWSTYHVELPENKSKLFEDLYRFWTTNRVWDVLILENVEDETAAISFLTAAGNHTKLFITDDLDLLVKVNITSMVPPDNSNDKIVEYMSEVMHIPDEGVSISSYVNDPGHVLRSLFVVEAGPYLKEVTKRLFLEIDDENIAKINATFIPKRRTTTVPPSTSAFYDGNLFPRKKRKKPKKKFKGMFKKKMNSTQIERGLRRNIKKLNKTNTNVTKTRRVRPRRIKLLNATVGNGTNRRKGRPRRIKLLNATVGNATNRRRGRPRRIKLLNATVGNATNRRRGRPRRIQLSNVTVRNVTKRRRVRPIKYKNRIKISDDFL